MLLIGVVFACDCVGVAVVCVVLAGLLHAPSAKTSRIKLIDTIRYINVVLVVALTMLRDTKCTLPFSPSLTTNGLVLLLSTEACDNATDSYQTLPCANHVK